MKTTLLTLRSFRISAIVAASMAFAPLVSQAATANLTWTGNAPVNTGDWTTSLTGAGNWTPLVVGHLHFFNGDFVTFNDSLTGTNVVNLADQVGPAGITFNNNAVNYVVSGTGSIAGTTGILKTGTGLVTLSASNSYSGTTSINAGTVKVQSDRALGSAAGSTVVSSGATLQFGNVNYTTAEGVTITGTGAGGVGAISNSGTSSFAGHVVLSGNSTISGGGAGNQLTLTGGVVKDGVTLTVGGGGTVIVSGNGITGASANSDLVVNASTLVLSASSSYNGPTTVQGSGVLQLGNNNVLPTSPLTDLTLNTGGVLNLASYSDSVASLKSDGSAIVKNSVLASTGTLTVNGTANTTFAGTIQGTLAGSQGNVALVKNGIGSLTLTGTNSYGGATSVRQGTLQVGDGSTGSINANSNVGILASGTLAVNLVNGGTLGNNITDNGLITLIANGTNSLGGSIGGSGVVAQNGTGVTIVTGSNSYSGLTNVNSGILRIKNDSALGSTAAGTVVANGATLQLAGGINVGSEALTISGSGAAGGFGVLENYSGANTYGGAITLAASALVSVDAGLMTLSGGINTAGHNLWLVGPAQGVISGSIIGSGNLNKVGVGLWTLSGSNSYTGVTNVTAGTLQVNADGALGSTVGNTVVSSTAALVFNNVNYTTAEGVTISGSGVSGGGAISNSGTSSFAGAITLAGNSLVSAGGAGNQLTLTGGLSKDGVTLTIGGGGTVVVSGVGISGASAHSDLVVDTSTLVLSATSSYNGPTTVQNGGTLQIGNNNVLPNAPYTDLTINTNGVLDMASHADSVASLTGDTSATVKNSVATTTGALKITGPGNTIYAGTIQGTQGGTQGDMSLIQGGVGTLTLTGTNSYTGATLVQQGTLQVGNGTIGSIDANSAVTVSSGGTLAVNLVDGGTFGNSGTNNGLITTIANGSNTLSGNFVGTGGLTQDGSGLTIISGSQNYTGSGATTVNQGTLQIGDGVSGYMSNSAGVIGDTVGSSGTVNVVAGGTWNTTNALLVGNYGSGTLNVSGGQVTDGGAFIGYNAGTASSVTVSSGTWTNNGDVYTGWLGASGTLNVSGGLATGHYLFVTASGGNATAVITGGTYNNANEAYIGYGGSGTLNVSGGLISNTRGVIGVSAGSVGQATVSGGTWSNSNGLVVGETGTGTLNITNGGTVNVVGGLNSLTLGAYNGSSGTLNLGLGGAAGTLNVAVVTGGLGSATVNFNQNGTYTFSPVLAGSLAVNNIGTGLTILTGSNSYDGLTSVNSGILRILNDTALGSTVGGTVVANGATLQLGGGINVGAEALTISGGGAAGTSGALANNSGNNTYGGAITLAANATIGSGAGLVTLTGGVDTAGYNLRIGGISNGVVASTITGAGNVGKIGTGTWTLSGSNNYTGNTDVTAGILNIQNNDALGSTAHGTVVDSGATLQMQGDITVGLEKLSLSGAGAAGQNGAFVNVSGSNTYNGLITLLADSQISSDGGLFIIGNNINGQHNLTLAGASNGIVQGNINIGNQQSLTETGPGTWTLLGTNHYGSTIINSGTLQIGDGGTLGSGPVTDNGALDFILSGTITVNNQIGGSGSVLQTGSGTTILGGNNSYTGPTTISSGILEVTSNNALGTADGGTTVLPGGTLLFGNVNYTTPEGVTITGSGSPGSGGAISNSGTSSFSGAITLNGTASISGGGVGNQLTLTGGIDKNGVDLIVDGGGTVIVANNGITGALPHSDLIVTNTSTLVLAVANSYNGPTTVQNSGTLQLGASNVLPTAPLTDLTINTGGAFNMHSYSDTVASLSGDATGTVKNSTPSTLSTLTINSGTSANYAGTIQGTQGGTQGDIALTKTGTGTQILSGNNSYGGLTSVNAGILNIQHSNGLGSTAGGTVVANGATLQLQNNISVGAEALSLTGVGASGQKGALVNVSGWNDYAGNITLLDPGAVISSDAGTLNLTGNIGATGPLNSPNLILTGSGNGIVAGVIDLGFSGALRKTGTGTWTLSGANTYSGFTQVNAGILNIQNNTALGTTVGNTVVANGATLQLQGGISVANAIQINGSGAAGQNGALVNLSGNNTLTGGLGLNGDSTISSDAGQLTIANSISGGGTNLTVTGAGNGIISGAINTSTGGLTKNGSGQWTLTGNSSYTGDTLITGGTLQIGNGTTGSINGTGTVTVALGSWSGVAGPSSSLTGDNTLAVNLANGGILSNKIVNNNLIVTTATGINTFSGDISGDGGFYQNGTGTTILTGSDKQQAIVIGQGTVQIGNGSNGSADFTVGVNVDTTGTLAINLANGGTYNNSSIGIYNYGQVQAIASGTNTISADISQTGSFIQNGSGTTILNSDNNSYTGLTNVLKGTLQVGDGSHGSIGGNQVTVSNGATLAVNLADGGNLFNNVTNNGLVKMIQAGTNTLWGSIDGSGGFIQAGTGLTNLNGVSTYTGTTSVLAGTLVANVDGALGSAAGPTVVSPNGTLEFDWTTYNTAESVTISGSGANGVGAISNIGVSSFAGAINLAANSLISAGGAGNQLTLTGGINKDGVTLTFGNGGTVIVSGTGITGASPHSDLIVTDTTTLVLSATSSYNGPTTVKNSATIQLGNNNVLPTGPGTDLTINTNGTLNMASYSDSVASLTGDATATVKNSVVGTTGTLTVNGASSTTYAGTIQGTLGGGDMALAKNGSGTLTLTGTNDYTGATLVQQGTLQVGNGTTGSIHAGSAVTVSSGGTLAVDLAGGGTFGNSGVNNGVITTIASGTNTLSGNFSGTGALTQNGSGLTIITGAESSTGLTTVQQGTLQVGDGTTGSISGSSTVVVNPGTTLAIDLANGGTFSSSGLNNGLINTIASGTNTLTGAFGGIGGLTQSGSGVTVIAGTESYTGATTVQTGTLQIGNGANGSINSSSPVAVSGGATLAIDLVNGGVFGNNVTDSGRITAIATGTNTLSGNLSGAGTFTQAGSGTTILSGSNSYSGGTTINAGALLANNSTGSATGSGAVLVNSGGLLGGNGSVAGLVTVASGGVIDPGMSPGSGVGTLRLNGGLTLNGGSLLDFQLGAPAASDLILIGGSNNFTTSMSGLNAGTQINLSESGGLVAGTLYELIGYGGAIQGSGTSGLAIGNLGIITGTHSYTATLNYSIPGQVDVLVQALRTWTGLAYDGPVVASGTAYGGVVVAGGTSSLWNLNSVGNWVPPSPNGIYFNNDNVTFDDTATGSTIVYLDNANGPLTPAVVDINNNALNYKFVGPGSISGTTGVLKTGSGLAWVTNTNNYTGATIINQGTFQVGDGTTGAINALSAVSTSGSGTLVVDLANGGVFGNTVSNNGLIATIASGTNTLSGNISGNGSLIQNGPGRTILNGVDSYSGTTTVQSGTLQIGDGVTGSINVASAVTVSSSGTLAIDLANGGLFGNNITDNGLVNTIASGINTLSGNIIGTGGLTQSGLGTAILTGSNTYSGTTTIAAGTLQIGNGGTTGNLGSGTVVDNGALVFDRSDTMTVGNLISGSGSVTQYSVGTTILTGTDTYTGPTNVTQGTLQIGNGATGSISGSSAVIINTGATLAINLVNSGTFSNTVADGGVINTIASGTNTLSGNISGNGSLTQNGSGRTILSGTDSYQGATNVNTGVLQIGNGVTGSINGNSLVTVLGSGTLAINLANNGIFSNTVIDQGLVNSIASGTNTLSGAIIGGGGLTQSGLGTTILTGNNNYTGPTTITAGILQIGNGGTTGNLGSGPIIDNSVLVIDRSDLITIDNVISGSGGLNQSGSGTTVLTGSNTYTGPTNVTLGTLQIGNSLTGMISGSSVVNVSSGAVLVLDLAYGSVFTNLVHDSGLVIADGPGNDFTIAGPITDGTTPGNFLKVDSNKVTLTGTNTYSGTTTVDNGILQIGNGNSGSINPASLVGISGSGTLAIDLVNGGVFNNTVTNSGTMTTIASGTNTISGPISGSGSFVQNGTGFTILSGSNSYSGPTLVEQGILNIRSNSALGSTAGGTIVSNGATLQVQGNINIGTEAVTLSGSGAPGQTGALVNVSGSNVLAGLVTLADNATISSDSGLLTLTGGIVGADRFLVLTGSGNGLESGVIAIGLGGIEKNGSGTWTLTGSNTYAGATNINAGILNIQNGSALGGAGVGFGGTKVLSGATLQLQGGITVGPELLTISGTGAPGQHGALVNVSGSNTWGGVITVGDNATVSSDAGFLTLNNTIDGNGTTLTLTGSSNGLVSGAIVIAANGGLNKDGSGKWTLTGTNTYTGATNVNAGILQIGDGLSGSLDPLTYITVAPAAILKVDLATSGTQLNNVINGTLINNITDNGSVNAIEGGTNTLSGAIIGSGTFNQGDPDFSSPTTGFTFLTGTNLYTGPTNVNTGTLQVGNGVTGSINGVSALTVSTNATLNIDLVNGGVFGNSGTNNGVINTIASGTNILTGGIAGTGTFNQNGTGFTLMTGTNTYTGPTNVILGTLQIGNSVTGMISGSSAVTIFQGATLVLDLPGNSVFSNTVLNNGLLNADGPGTNYTISGIISGTGRFLKTDINTVTLTGSSTYTGPTDVQQGTLRIGDDTTGNISALSYVTIDPAANLDVQLGNGQTLGSSITNNGSINAIETGTNTLSGVIIGSGMFNQNGTGVTILTNASNGFTGPVNINNGTLRAGNAFVMGNLPAVTVAGPGVFDLNSFDQEIGSLAGDGSVTLGTATLTTGGNNTSTLFSGIISGAGNVVKTGAASTWTLSGPNSYTGTTHIKEGTIQAGAANILSMSTAVTVDAGAKFNLADFSQSIGSLAGAGTVTLGSLSTTILTTGNDNTNTTFSGWIDGAGQVNKTGTGMWTLTGSNNYWGGTTITSGIIGCANDWAMGWGTVTMHDGTTLLSIGGNWTLANLFVLLDDPTFDTTGGSLGLTGAVTGTGTLVKDGQNTLTLLSNLNSYTGDTFINTGTMQIGNGISGLMTNGSSTFHIAAGAQLNIDMPTTGDLMNNIIDNGMIDAIQMGTNTLSGNISGLGGSLVQDGPGVTILTNSNSYTGGTVINNGGLVVSNMNGLGNGNVTLNSGRLSTTLGVGYPVIVNGDYTQNGGTLALELFGANQNQMVQVTGAAVLNGGTLAISGFNPILTGPNALVNLHSTYTLLNSSTLTGSLALSNPFPSTGTVMKLHLTYPGNTVELSYYQAIKFVNVIAPDLTPNQGSVAAALDRLANAIGNPAPIGPFLKLMDQLDITGTGQLPAVYDLIAPEEYASMPTMALSGIDIHTTNIEHRMFEIRNGVTGFSASGLQVSDGKGSVDFEKSKNGKDVVEKQPEKPVNDKMAFWVAGAGQFVNVRSDENGSAYDLTTAGITVGLDYRFSEILSAGLIGGYQNTQTSLVNNGNIALNGGKGGVYATYHEKGWYANALMTGGYDSYTTKRAAFGGDATGSTDGSEFEGYLGGGYDLTGSNWALGPTAKLQYSYVNINNFTENGSLAPLNINSQSDNSFVSRLGAHATYKMQIGKIAVTPDLSVEWEHQYLGSSYSVTSSFAGGSGIGGDFSVSGPQLGTNSARVNVGVNVQFTPRVSSFLYYNGQYGQRFISNSVNGGVSVGF